MKSPVELPEDTVRKILTKLPVRTLVRFSCVCKLWRDLVIKIKNPNLFGERHLDSPNNLCNDQPTLVFFRRLLGDGDKIPSAAEDSLLTHKTSHVLSPPDSLADTDIAVMAACNGIVCLASCKTDVVHLYNPITREVLNLPPSLLSDQAKKCCCHQILGFGFDASCNDYKVIRILRYYSGVDQEIYRHSTRCWSKLELDYDYITFNDHDDGVVFFNGFSHWPIWKIMFDWRRGGPKILTFNFETEKLGEMQYPDQILNKCSVKCLTEMNNSLAVCSYHDTKLEVWVMSEYGKKESWTMKFLVDLSVSIRRVLSVRVHNTRLVVLGAYFTRTQEGGFGWREEGGECSTMFGGVLRPRSSWVHFRPSLVSLSHKAR